VNTAQDPAHFQKLPGGFRMAVQLNYLQMYYLLAVIVKEVVRYISTKVEEQHSQTQKRQLPVLL
jgi:hypothetical protein